MGACNLTAKEIMKEKQVKTARSRSLGKNFIKDSAEEFGPLMLVQKNRRPRMGPPRNSSAGQGGSARKKVARYDALYNKLQI